MMNHYYKSLWQLLIGISLFKKSPAEVETSLYLLQLSFIAYVLSGFTLLCVDRAIPTALFQSFFEVALLSIFMYFLLGFFGKSSRYLPTIIAMFGCGAVIGFLSSPIIFTLRNVSEHSEMVPLLAMVVLILVCWSLTVMAYIIHKAIDKALSVCLLITFCYAYLSYQLIYFMFPLDIN